MVKYLTREEEERLLEGVSGRYKKRDQAILTLMINTGLRVGELCKLIIGDVLNGKGVKKELQVRKSTTKGKTPRDIPLNSKSRKAIRTLLNWNKKNKLDLSLNNYLLLSQKKRKFTPVQVFRIIKQANEKARIDFTPHPHTFRHTFATRVYEKTNNLRVVQKLLGHKNVGTTQIYADVTREQLKNAVDKI